MSLHPRRRRADDAGLTQVVPSEVVAFALGVVVGAVLVLCARVVMLSARL